jgi:hypothetical protein
MRAATMSAVSRARRSGLHTIETISTPAATSASAAACSRPVASSGTGRWPWKRPSWL